MNATYLDIIVASLNDSLEKRKEQENEYLDKINDLKKGEKTDLELLDLLLGIRQLTENPEMVMEITVQKGSLNVEFLDDQQSSYRERCQKLVKEKNDSKALNKSLRSQIKEQRGKVLIQK